MGTIIVSSFVCSEDEYLLGIFVVAEGETSVVRPWHLRPTLVWKDGEWIEWSSSRRKDRPSQVSSLHVHMLL